LRQAGPSCFKCKHLKITWDQAKPYACLAMGFKSKQIPTLVVRRESGQPCLLFTPKPRAAARRDPGPGPGGPGGLGGGWLV